MTSNLVFGATGAIGRFLLPRLLARGERIVAVSRRSSADSAGNGVEWLRADLFAAMPPLPVVDTIYSLGPLDVFAEWFGRAVGEKPLARRLIAISSMSAESKEDSVDAAERELAARLRDAEQDLFAAAHRCGAACTIFRPTLIYGAGIDRSLAPLARFARRWHVLPVPLGASGLRQPVHAGDLAAACIAARDKAATFGKIYALGGGERLRFDTMLARIVASSPHAAVALPVPKPLLEVAMRLSRGRAGALSRLRVDLLADNVPAGRDFDYAPRAFQAHDVLPDA